MPHMMVPMAGLQEENRDAATTLSPLRGCTIACTGRLASMSRAAFENLVERQGGQFVPSVSRKTTHLVLGQEGWPLQNNGRLSNKLQQAKQLLAQGAEIKILSEESFLGSLGVLEQTEIHRRYSLPELCRMLEIPRQRIESWVNASILQPIETKEGVWFFDFTQVTGARMIVDFLNKGVSLPRIRKSLEVLRQWLGDAEPLTRLIDRDGQLLVRVSQDQLCDATGQLQFDFTEESEHEPVVSFASMDAPPQNGDWFDKGFAFEQNEQWEEAITCYRRSLIENGPNIETSFNLANSLWANGNCEQAIERFWQVIEQSPQHYEAYSNLGLVLNELKQTDAAIEALTKSLECNPQFSDAHYNLADVLDEAGRPKEARPHWQAYLRAQPEGPWSDYARFRLFAG